MTFAKLCACTLLVGAVVCFEFHSPALAEKKVVTPVDENGNPTGPSKEIDFPDNPTGGAVVQPVDKDGNAVGGPVVIPDAPASGGHQASPEPENTPDADPTPGDGSDEDPSLVPEE